MARRAEGDRVPSRNLLHADPIALTLGGGAPTASASGTIIARSMPRTVALRRWRAYLAGDVADPSLP